MMEQRDSGAHLLVSPLSKLCIETQGLLLPLANGNAEGDLKSQSAQDRFKNILNCAEIIYYALGFTRQAVLQRLSDILLQLAQELMERSESNAPAATIEQKQIEDVLTGFTLLGELLVQGWSDESSVNAFVSSIHWSDGSEGVTHLDAIQDILRVADFPPGHKPNLTEQDRVSVYNQSAKRCTAALTTFLEKNKSNDALGEFASAFKTLRHCCDNKTVSALFWVAETYSRILKDTKTNTLSTRFLRSLTLMTSDLVSQGPEISALNIKVDILGEVLSQCRSFKGNQSYTRELLSAVGCENSGGSSLSPIRPNVTHIYRLLELELGKVSIQLSKLELAPDSSKFEAFSTRVASMLATVNIMNGESGDLQDKLKEILKIIERPSLVERDYSRLASLISSSQEIVSEVTAGVFFSQFTDKLSPDTVREVMRTARNEISNAIELLEGLDSGETSDRNFYAFSHILYDVGCVLDFIGSDTVAHHLRRAGIFLSHKDISFFSKSGNGLEIASTIACGIEIYLTLILSEQTPDKQIIISAISAINDMVGDTVLSEKFNVRYENTRSFASTTDDVREDLREIANELDLMIQGGPSVIDYKKTIGFLSDAKSLASIRENPGLAREVSRAIDEIDELYISNLTLDQEYPAVRKIIEHACAELTRSLSENNSDKLEWNNDLRDHEITAVEKYVVSPELMSLAVGQYSARRGLLRSHLNAHNPDWKAISNLMHAFAGDATSCNIDGPAAFFKKIESGLAEPLRKERKINPVLKQFLVKAFTVLDGIFEQRDFSNEMTGWLDDLADFDFEAPNSPSVESVAKSTSKIAADAVEIEDDIVVLSEIVEIDDVEQTPNSELKIEPETAKNNKPLPNEVQLDESRIKDVSVEDDILEIYLGEAEEAMAESELIIQKYKVKELLDNYKNREVLSTLKRHMHTIKGGARMLQLTGIAYCFHAMEGLLQGLKDGKIAYEEKMEDIIQTVFKEIRIGISHAENYKCYTPPENLMAILRCIVEYKTIHPSKRNSNAINNVFEEPYSPIVASNEVSVPAQEHKESNETATQDQVLDDEEFEVDDEILQDFVEECNGALSGIFRILKNKNIKEIIEKPGSELRGLREHMHMAKGGARMVQMQAVAQSFHALEGLLEDLESNKISYTPFIEEYVGSVLREIKKSIECAEEYKQYQPDVVFLRELDELINFSKLPVRLTARAVGDRGVANVSITEVHTPLPALAEDTKETIEALTPSKKESVVKPAAAKPKSTSRKVTNISDAPTALAQKKDKIGSKEEEISSVELEKKLNALAVQKSRGQSKKMKGVNNSKLNIVSADLDGIVERSNAVYEKFDRVRNLTKVLADVMGNTRTSAALLKEAMNAIKASDPGNPTVRMVADTAEAIIGDVGDIESCAQYLFDAIDSPLPLIREIQEISTRTRLVKIGEMRGSFELKVRSESELLGKKAKLTFIGENTKLDKPIREKLDSQIINHIISNAIAHGIESPSERIAKGKPETGEIRIVAESSGKQFKLSISDDGAGIDPKVLLNVAIEKGIIESGTKLSRGEVFELLLHEGFSTASEEAIAAQAAGKGVGAGSFKRMIDDLNGTIEITSEVGKGTTFSATFPTSAGTTPCLICLDRGERFAIPSNRVRGIYALERDDFARAEKSGAIGNRKHKALRLTEALGIRFTHKQRPSVEGYYLVVNHKEETLALLVDDVVEKVELFVRDAPSIIQTIPGVGGYSQCSNGAPVLIVDPVIRMRETVRSTEKGVLLNEDKFVLSKRQFSPVVLVVEDSSTLRRAVKDSLLVAGITTHEAADAEKGIGYLMENAAPDAIILDLDLPGMSGEVFYSQIRSIDKLSAIPIIVYTGKDRIDISKDLVTRERILYKPVSDENLINAVKEVLE